MINNMLNKIIIIKIPSHRDPFGVILSNNIFTQYHMKQTLTNSTRRKTAPTVLMIRQKIPRYKIPE
jgi:hypothetical protein